MNFPGNAQLAQAISKRHSVRQYHATPVSDEIIDCLQTEVDRINERCGLSFKVVTQEPKSFKNILAYGNFEQAVNYIIISAPKGDAYTRQCGFEGERLVLGLQALGLNTCWVGLSYSKNTDVFKVPKGHKIRCVISFGYGQTPGFPRKSKTVAQLSNATENAPEWFIRAMTAVMAAPTAVNQQKFFFELKADGHATARSLFSLIGYTQIDLGIAICHFNLAAAGHEISLSDIQ